MRVEVTTAEEVQRRLMAGRRPSSPTVATSPARLHFSLLRDLQRVVDLDPEVSDCAFQLGVSKQEGSGANRESWHKRVQLDRYLHEVTIQS